MTITRYDQIYGALVCEDVPRTQLRLTDDTDDAPADPWDGVKPYAKDGFVTNYCMDDRKEATS